MTFGAEMRDQNGRLFAKIDREAYHFWGYVDLYPSGSLQTVSLLNIPTWLPIAVFVSVELGPITTAYTQRGGHVSISNNGAVWTATSIKHAANNSVFNHARVFIFLPARYIPAWVWGLQCFAADGTKFFESSRPLLQLCGLGNGGAGGSYFNRTPRRVASVIGVEFYLQTINTQFGWLHQTYYGTDVALDGGYTPMIWTYGAYQSNAVFQNVSLIDYDYYSSFGSLGNFA